RQSVHRGRRPSDLQSGGQAPTHHRAAFAALELCFWRIGLSYPVHHRTGSGLPHATGREGGVLNASDPDDRRYPKRPMVGVGAIILRRDRILMAQRGKEPLKGWWSLPGGALEIGESLKHGVCREVREETGLEIRPLGVFEIFERIMHDTAGAPE